MVAELCDPGLLPVCISGGTLGAQCDAGGNRDAGRAVVAGDCDLAQCRAGGSGRSPPDRRNDPVCAVDSIESRDTHTTAWLGELRDSIRDPLFSMAPRKANSP